MISTKKKEGKNLEVFATKPRDRIVKCNFLNQNMDEQLYMALMAGDKK